MLFKEIYTFVFFLDGVIEMAFLCYSLTQCENNLMVLLTDFTLKTFYL